MKKITLEEIAKLQDQAEAKRAAINDEISNLLKQEAELSEAAKAAAASGDLDGFRAKNAEKSLVSDAIYCKRVQLDNLAAPFSEEDIRAAWHDYAERYGRDFAKAYDRYKESKRKLRAEFMQLVMMQNEALQQKEKISGLAGSRLSEIPMIETSMTSSERKVRFTMLYETPDILLFRAGLNSDKEDADILQLFTAVIQDGKAF